MGINPLIRGVDSKPERRRKSFGLHPMSINPLIRGVDSKREILGTRDCTIQYQSSNSRRWFEARKAAEKYWMSAYQSSNSRRWFEDIYLRVTEHTTTYQSSNSRRWFEAHSTQPSTSISSINPLIRGVDSKAGRDLHSSPDLLRINPLIRGVDSKERGSPEIAGG